MTPEPTRSKAYPSHVRIGVVLPSDRRESLLLTIPAAGFSVGGAAIGPGPVWAVVDEGAIVLKHAARSLGRRPFWTMEPAVKREDTGVVVRDCAAGRGFHWSKTVDVVLPGRIELTVRDGFLFAVNDLPIEAYLKGVITSEMSGECPAAFLKAQCIASRSWIVAATERKHADLGIDFCNDDCCQRYQGVGVVTRAAREAVEETAGEVLLHRSGEVVDANYSKCCGGIVEAPECVWGFAKPGQRCVVDAPASDRTHAFHPLSERVIGEYVRGAWLADCHAYCSPSAVSERDVARYLGRVDDGRGRFRWSVTRSAEEIARTLVEKHLAPLGMRDDAGCTRIRDLRVTRRAPGGRATQVQIDYVGKDDSARRATIDGEYEIRRALHDSFLYSSAFDVRIERDAQGWPKRFEFAGAGWGHGAGMCQIGALGMALQGFNHERILHHYFEGVRIGKRIGPWTDWLSKPCDYSRLA